MTTDTTAPESGEQPDPASSAGTPAESETAEAVESGRRRPYRGRHRRPMSVFTRGNES